MLRHQNPDARRPYRQVPASPLPEPSVSLRTKEETNGVALRKYFGRESSLAGSPHTREGASAVHRAALGHTATPTEAPEHHLSY